MLLNHGSVRLRSPYRTGDYATFPYMQSQSALSGITCPSPKLVICHSCSARGKGRAFLSTQNKAFMGGVSCAKKGEDGTRRRDHVIRSEDGHNLLRDSRECPAQCDRATNPKTVVYEPGPFVALVVEK